MSPPLTGDYLCIDKDEGTLVNCQHSNSPELSEKGGIPQWPSQCHNSWFISLVTVKPQWPKDHSHFSFDFIVTLGVPRQIKEVFVPCHRVFAAGFPRCGREE